ncbi:MAG: aspartate-semialdehyde dehydrogenase [Patescibacteria group bacterium]
MKKLRVGILGATGSVGQRFVALLSDHPWFTVTALAASEKSAGKPYRNAVNWKMATPIPDDVARLVIMEASPPLPCDLVFSGLDASVAGEIEEAFAKSGYPVISNSKNHRMDSDVPLLIPEVNADHIDIILSQKRNRHYTAGFIVTNPNCSVVGLTIALKPLHDTFGVERVHVVTMQALSGAGFPGVASMDITDNVIPYIGGEEEKLETEPQKILSTPILISAQCNRVPVTDGHLEAVSVKLTKKATLEEVKEALRSFRGEPQKLHLPSAPEYPIVVMDEDNRPQPRLDRNLENGMAVSVGRIRPCSLLDYKFIVLSHNTIRGAAGAAILNAELLHKRGLLSRRTL